MSRRWRDPYEAVIRAFTRVGVRYIVVGMAGINYYARRPPETFATMDYDVLLEPALANVEQALRQIKRLGFSIGTARGAPTPSDLPTIVRERRTLVAMTPDGVMVELLLAVSGFSFANLAKDAATVVVHGTPIKVGRLTKLLQSKRAADRPKDRAFLRRYQAMLEELPRVEPHG